MCFGGGDGGAGEIARQQRADEVARQERIKSGMQKINSIFDGQVTGAADAATAYDPSKTYYMSDGSVFGPGGNFAGGSGFGGMFGQFANIASGRQRAEDLIKQGKLFTRQTRQGGFGDEYFQKQAKAYTDYATPQLDRSYKQAKDNMIFALDRSGILQSSAAVNKNTDLGNEFDQARLDISNTAQNKANEARSNLENVRSNLVTQLNATGDDQAAAAGAIRQAQALNQPQTAFSPLTQLFSNFTQGLSAIGSNARNDYGGFFGRGGGLFTNSGGSARVVG